VTLQMLCSAAAKRLVHSSQAVLAFQSCCCRVAEWFAFWSVGRTVRTHNGPDSF
jgi:hypothetical protein